MAQQADQPSSSPSGQNQQFDPRQQPPPGQQPWPGQQPPSGYYPPPSGYYQIPGQQPVPGYYQMPYQQQRLGGCLITWVAASLIVNVLVLFISFLQASPSPIYLIDPISFLPVPFLPALLYVLAIIGHIGVLQRRKRGYELVLIIYALLTIGRIATLFITSGPRLYTLLIHISSTSIALPIPSLISIVFGIIGALIFYALIQDAKQSFR